jgi:hypothetical protein
VTALVNLIDDVRVAMAARTTAGDGTAKSALWCSPTPNTFRPKVSASSA